MRRLPRPKTMLARAARHASFAIGCIWFVVGHVHAQTFVPIIPPGNDLSGVIPDFAAPGAQSLVVGFNGAREANMNGLGASFDGGVFVGAGDPFSVGHLRVNLPNSNVSATPPFPQIRLAAFDDTRGTLSVLGGSVSSQFMVVGAGANSNGRLSITDGEVFVTAPNDPLVVPPGLQIARDGVGSVGLVNVSGGFFAQHTGIGRLNVDGQVSIGRTGNGTLTVGQEGEAIIGGPITLASSSNPSGLGTLSVTDVGSRVAAQVVLAGVELVAAPPPVGGIPYLGNFAKSFGSPFSFEPAGSAHGIGRVFVSNGAILQSDVILGPGGSLNGSGGTITGNVGNYGGAVAPGNSPGHITIEGEYLQIGGTLEIEIASETDFDVLNVLGPATFQAANVHFSFIEGFAPTEGFEFQFLSAELQSVQDTTFSYSGLAPGFVFTVGPGQEPGALIFAALNDGVLVPEPASALLLILGGGALLVRRRLRRNCLDV